MPVPINDASAALRINADKTERALKKVPNTNYYFRVDSVISLRIFCSDFREFISS